MLLLYDKKIILYYHITDKFMRLHKVYDDGINRFTHDINIQGAIVIETLCQDRLQLNSK